LIAYFTGGWLLDVAKLTWGQVDVVEGVIRFQQLKGDKPVIVPIHPQLLDYLLSRAGDGSERPRIADALPQEGIRIPWAIDDVQGLNVGGRH